MDLARLGPTLLLLATATLTGLSGCGVLRADDDGLVGLDDDDSATGLAGDDDSATPADLDDDGGGAAHPDPDTPLVPSSPQLPSEGVLMFRGSPLRDRHGVGALPRRQVEVVWRQRVGCFQEWCGVGWTGQPLLVDWPDDARAVQDFAEPGGPAVEAIVGGLDGYVYFVDLDSGRPSRPRLRAQTAAIKGTVSVDPRGAPLLYVGQGLPGPDRDWHVRAYSLINRRVMLDIPGSQRSFGGDEPLAPMRGWGGSDGNVLVRPDADGLLHGGENGLFYRVALHTDWDGQRIGLDPVVDPLTYHAVRPKYGDATHDGASRWAPGIESSVALLDGVAYFADSAGSLIGVRPDTGAEVLRLDLGDDTDASPMIAIEEGHPYLYIGSEVDLQIQRRPGVFSGTLRFSKVDLETGAFAWRLELPAQTLKRSDYRHDFNGGVLATAAPGAGPSAELVFVPTAHEPKLNQGRLLAVRRAPGEDGEPVIAWSRPLHGAAWSSPATDGTTVVAADSTGWIHAFDAVSGEPLWELSLEGAVESSPVFWDGRIVVGVRGGALLALAEVDPPPAEAPGDGDEPSTPLDPDFDPVTEIVIEDEPVPPTP